jgi:hypothetical protein
MAPRFLGLRSLCSISAFSSSTIGATSAGIAPSTALRLARAQPRDLLAHLAQRPQAVPGLQPAITISPSASSTKLRTSVRRSTRSARRALAALRHLEAPAHRRSGQLDVALEDAQLLVLELAIRLS